jgi:hypothetical protein
MRAVLTLQLGGNCGWLQGRDLTLRRIVWMKMPNSLFTGFFYILVDGDATGLTDVREVGGGLRESILVQALSELDGGRRRPRYLPLSLVQPVGPLEEGVYSAQALQHREAGYLWGVREVLHAGSRRIDSRIASTVRG